MSYKPKTMKIIGIATEELEAFYRMLGLDEVYVVTDKDKEKIKSIVDDLMIRDDVAIVLVQVKLFEIVRELTAQQKKMYPIFIAFPDPSELKRFDIYEFYRPLIRKYIGFEVTLT